MNDKKFLEWIHDRLHCVYGEKYNIDYLCKLRAIIAATDDHKYTPNILVEKK